MRVATRSLKLIDQKLRDDPTANRLFLEILTSRAAPRSVLRRMNEAGVLGRFMPDFGRIVAMMQFNMYHHYTVDEHLLRCIGILADIDRGGSEEHPLANELMQHDPEAASRRCSTSRCSCTTSPRAGPRTIRSPARASRGDSVPRLGLSASRDRARRLAGRAASPDVDRSRSRATSPTARRSRISPPWCSRWSG